MESSCTLLRMGGSLVLVGALGCATAADVSGRDAIATARYAITEAESQGAAEVAPEPLERARVKLAEAEELSEGGSAAAARRKADQAAVDAQLAGAVARREAARAKLEEVQKVGRDAYELRQETTDAARERVQ